MCIAEYFRIHHACRTPTPECGNDAPEPGFRERGKALIGPAERVRRDDSVVHRKQRITRINGLGLEHVDRR
jgi:hypothetical protein